MAPKQGKKTGKAMGKKQMKKTKGGAVDAFIWFSPTNPTAAPLNNPVGGKNIQPGTLFQKQ
jgi:hypothetical protein